jgi:hypothetical protein
MPTRRSSVEAVLTAIVSALKSSTGVTGVATGGIYNNVPQNTPYPYVVVTSPTGRPSDTLGSLGSSVLVDLRAVSQYAGDKEAAQIIDQCQRAINFQKPAVSGHRICALNLESEERYQELVNAIPTRHHVATFRVWTEQSSS